MGVVGVEQGVVGVTGDAGMGDMRPLRGTSAGAGAEDIITRPMHELSGSDCSSASTSMSGGDARGLTRWWCPSPIPSPTLVSHESKVAMRCDGGGVTARRLRRCPGTSPYTPVGLVGDTGEVGLTGEGLATGGGLGLRRRDCACAASSSDIAIVMLAMAGSGAE